LLAGYLGSYLLPERFGEALFECRDLLAQALGLSSRVLRVGA
jgi:hypothetical protein